MPTKSTSLVLRVRVASCSSWQWLHVVVVVEEATRGGLVGVSSTLSSSSSP